MNSAVSDFIQKSHNKSILEAIRSILLKKELDETIKWAAPHYLFNKEIIIGLGSFKSYAGIWFHQGVFLSDKQGVLHNAQEGNTKALRQWRFTFGDQLDLNLIEAYIDEAIQNAKDGKRMTNASPKRPIEISPALQNLLEKDLKLLEKFSGLSPGKQREYHDYIRSAKQEKTKQARLLKCMDLINAGVGLNDRYK